MGYKYVFNVFTSKMDLVPDTTGFLTQTTADSLYLKLDQTTPQTTVGTLNFPRAILGGHIDDTATPLMAYSATTAAVFSGDIQTAGFGSSTNGVLRVGSGGMSVYGIIDDGTDPASPKNSIDPRGRLLYKPDGTTVAIDWSGTTYNYGVYINTVQTNNIFPAGNSSVAFGSGGDVDVYLRDIYMSNGGGRLIDPVNQPSVGWGNRILYDINGSAILDWSNQYSGGLLSGNGYYGIDFNSANLVDTATTSVDWQNHLLYCTSSPGGSDYGVTVDWQAQQLKSTDPSYTSILSLDWKNRTLNDTNGASCVTWGTGGISLYVSGITTIGTSSPNSAMLTVDANGNAYAINATGNINLNGRFLLGGATDDGLTNVNIVNYYSNSIGLSINAAANGSVELMNNSTGIAGYFSDSMGGHSVNLADGTYAINATGNAIATSWITSGGASTDFVKGDGSLDSSTYLTTETDPVFSAWLIATPPIYSLAGAWLLNGNTNGAKKTLGSVDNYDIGFITNNTEKLTILKGGNVGIGTTGPGYLLDVNGTGANGALAIRIKNTSSAASQTAEFRAENNLGYSARMFKLGSGYGTYKTLASNDIGFYNDSSAGNISILNDYASGKILFTAGAASTAQMLIDTNGNVGIGVLSPVNKLHISGAGSTALGGIEIDSTGTSGYGAYFRLKPLQTGSHIYTFSAGGDLDGTGGNLLGKFSIYDETVLEARLVINTVGNLGINTYTPAAKIHAVSTTEQLRLGYDGSNYLSHTTNSTGTSTITPVGTTPYLLLGKQVYGSMYADDVTITVTIAAASTYYTIGTGLTTGSVNGMTFTSTGSTLTALVAGKYKVDWSMTVNSGSAGQEVSGTIMINTTAQMQTEGACKLTTANDNKCIAGSGIITLAVNDTVKLCVENETNANNIVVTHASMSIIRIDA